MPLENALVVARREYLARVRTKGFWLATIALPLLLAAMGVVPTLLMVGADTGQRLVVVDETGEIGDLLRRELGASEIPGLQEVAGFTLTVEAPAADRQAQRAELNRRVLDGEIDAWSWLDDASITEGRIGYNAESVSNFLTQERLEDALSRAVRVYRLERAGYDAEAVSELTSGVRLKTSKISEEGEKEEGAEAGIILAYLLFFLLYMVLLIYGQQVMNGVLEEKTSRIVEVIVSTTRPFELMLGKLTGVCCTALTQLGIWLAALAVVTLPGVVSAMAWIPEEVDLPTFAPGIFLHFLICFLLGFFLFSSVYAAIGAAFNNVQEAQQFASVAVFFLIAPVFFFWVVINDPDSTVSVVTSLVPLFTPLLMMLRIAIKTPPAWQIVLGYLLTALATWASIWAGARIYRTGILMYGKKPSARELWRWLRRA